MVAPLLKPVFAQTTILRIANSTTGNTNISFTNTSPPPTTADYPLGYFIINITVIDVVSLAAWQINITWNKDLLQIANKAMNADMFIPNDNVFLNYPDPVEPDITNTYAFWMVGIKSGGPTSFTGSGTLCQIRFNVTRAPIEGETLSCNIHFVISAEYPIYTSLVDPDAMDILYTPEDGLYEYSYPPPPPPPSEGAVMALEPPSIIDSSILPPQIVEYNVTIKNVTDMYGYQFKLNYDQNMLYCLSLTVLDILGETNYITSFSVDNNVGLISVSVAFEPPAVPITTELEVPIVALVFRVKGIGGTWLNLTDTSIVDSLARLIPHAVHNGLFINVVRDLAVTNVVCSSDWVYQGNTRKVNVTVENHGEIIETSIIVNVRYDGNLLASTTVPTLNPGDAIELTFTWNTSGVPCCINYTISGEAVPVPWELNTANNIFVDGQIRVRLFGDINDDRVVDVHDLQLMKLAIPSFPGVGNWNPYADLNDDGIVDGKDYVLLKKNVGKHC